MAFRAGSFSQCVYAACQHLRSAELAAPGSCSTQPSNDQSQPAGPEGCDKVMKVKMFPAWASEVRFLLHRLQISNGDIYSRIDRTARGIWTTWPSRRLPDWHGWWNLQWHERKMQRVTVWHRCTLMEVRLTSLQAHTDLKWQIAPCWERSIFGATPTPTLRVTNAADYIHTLWNSLNYTKLWTSLAHREYTWISRSVIYNVKNIKSVHPFYFSWTILCQSKRLLKLLSAQSKSIQSR